MGGIRIGTCSWRFPSWHGLVYSAPKGIDYLGEYAQQYDTVEIDRWFWSLFKPGEAVMPQVADAQAYRDAVSDDFRFTIKMPNSVTLTHLYRKDKQDPLVRNEHFLSPTLVETFLSQIVPLQDVASVLMFQFEYLNRQKMGSQQAFQEQFEAFAAQLPRPYPYALEVRNPQYLNELYFEFLERAGIFPVLVQGYWMPPVASVYRAWQPLIAGHERVVIRLLGPDRKGIEQLTGKRWDRLAAPRDEELASVVEVAQDLAGRGVEVYVNVNNHYEGSAPLTIERIERLLGDEAR